MRIEIVIGIKIVIVIKIVKEEIKMRLVMIRIMRKIRVIDRNIDSYKCNDSEVLGIVILIVIRRDSNNEEVVLKRLL